MADPSPSGSDLTFAGDFPPADRDAWLAMLEKTIAGGFEALCRETEDGVTVLPVYMAADAPEISPGLPGAPPFVRGATAARSGLGWDIRQPVLHPTPETANTAILEDLERGANSIRLTVRANVVADGGLVLGALADLARALDGVYLDLAPVEVRAGADAPAAAALLLALWDKRGYRADAGVAGCLGLDPLGTLARDGALPLPLDRAMADMAGLARHVIEARPDVATVAVDGSVWYGAGATEAQDLACCIAAGTEYLRALTNGGLAVGAAARQIAFTLDIGTDLFDGIAKPRAARRLWARVCEASGAPAAARAMRLGAALSMRAVAKRDPWVNMLRNTAACFAAAVGGVQWITLLPHSAGLTNLTGADLTGTGTDPVGGGVPDGLARRIARNVHVILQEESHLGQVADPAGGSWFLESLTDGLARAAWARFQDIERAGGLAAALTDGLIHGWLEDTDAIRATDIAHRKRPITGVSEFPDLSEPDVAMEPVRLPDAGEAVGAIPVLPSDPAARIAALLDKAADGVSLAALSAALNAGGGRATTVQPLPRVRLAEAWEALRDASDRRLAVHGARPRIFLACLGPVSRHGARAAFARNAFEAGGIEAVGIEAGGIEAGGIGDPIAAFKDSGAPLAVLCGGDDDYGSSAAAMARALKAAGCTRLWLAGRAGNRAEDWAMAGIDGYIGIGMDILGVLRDAHRHLGLAGAGDSA